MYVRMGQRYKIVQSLFEITQSLQEIDPAELNRVELLGKDCGTRIL